MKRKPVQGVGYREDELADRENNANSTNPKLPYRYRARPLPAQPTARPCQYCNSDSVSF
jgi:hypothetical protein